MAWLREIDEWFSSQVLPSAATYRAYARSLVADVSEAEDLVQEAYARVLSLPDWRKLDAPERFVIRVIRNLAVDRFRREKIIDLRQAGRLNLEAVPDPAPDAYEATSARQELEVVLAAVSDLPKACRQVLILRKMHGLSPRQIAEKLGLSVSTVEKHLSKALRLLALATSEHGRSGIRTFSWPAKARRNVRR